MANARRIVIEFLGKDKSLSSTANNIAGDTGKLQKRFSTVGLAAKAGFAVAGAAAVKFGGDAISEASDLNETLSKSQVIFGKQAPAMEKWASGAARSAGLSKQAALETASSFGDMFSQIGFAGGEAASMSKNVVQLAADLGSFNNLDTAEVTDMLSGAFRGEYDSLQRVIPNINAARVETEALAATGKKSAKELTAQEKAAATLAIVQKDGARASGDFARTSGGLANQQKILGAQFDNMKAKIGTGLLPVATKLITWANALMPILGRVGTWIGTNVMPKLRELGSFIGGVLGPVFKRFAGDGPGAMDKLRQVAAPIVATFRNLWATVQPIITQVVATIRANWGPISAWASQTFGQVRQIVTLAMQTIAQVIRVVTTVIRAVWKRWGDDYLAIAKRVWSAIGGVITGALSIIRGVLKTVLSVLRGDWKGAWNGIKSILSGAWTVMRSIVSLAWAGIRAAISKGISAAIGLVKSLPGRIVGALGKLGGLLLSAGSDIIGGLLRGITNRAKDIVTTIKNTVTDKIPGFIKKAMGIASPAKKMIPIGRHIIDGISKGFGYGRKGLQAALEGVQGIVTKWADRLTSLKQARADIVSSVRGFTSSVFGQDLSTERTDANGNTTTKAATAKSLVAYQAAERRKAAQLRKDVRLLIGRGLSKDLIAQMVNQGEAGIANIRALATGSKSDIAQLNRLNAATQADLAAAGMRAGNALYGRQINQASAEVAAGKQIIAEMRRLRNLEDKNTKVVIELGGRSLHVSLLELKRKTGKKLRLD